MFHQIYKIQSYYVLLGDFLKVITQLLQILPLCLVFFKLDYVSDRIYKIKNDIDILHTKPTIVKYKCAWGVRVFAV